MQPENPTTAGPVQRRDAQSGKDEPILDAGTTSPTERRLALFLKRLRFSHEKWHHRLAAAAISSAATLIVGAVLATLAASPQGKRVLFGVNYEVEADQRDVFFGESADLRLRARYGDGSEASLNGVQCEWSANPPLHGLSERNGRCETTLALSHPDFISGGARATSVNVDICESLPENCTQRPERKHAKILIWVHPYDIPAIVRAPPTVAYGKEIPLQVKFHYLNGDTSCRWSPPNMFDNAYICTPRFEAPRDRALAKSATILVELDTLSTSVVDGGVTHNIHATSAKYNVDFVEDPYVATSSVASLTGRTHESIDVQKGATRIRPNVAAKSETAAITSENSHKSCEDCFLRVLQAVSANSGDARYTALANAMPMLSDATLSGADIAALLNGISDQRLRINAIENWLLPRLRRPISSDDTRLVLGGLWGTHRVELLAELRPCMKEPIDDTVRNDLLEGETGDTFREANAILQQTGAVCSHVANP